MATLEAMTIRKAKEEGGLGRACSIECLASSRQSIFVCYLSFVKFITLLPRLSENELNVHCGLHEPFLLLRIVIEVSLRPVLVVCCLYLFLDHVTSVFFLSLDHQRFSSILHQLTISNP
jgi:hypothetical protein